MFYVIKTDVLRILRRNKLPEYFKILNNTEYLIKPVGFLWRKYQVNAVCWPKYYISSYIIGETIGIFKSLEEAEIYLKLIQ